MIFHCLASGCTIHSVWNPLPVLSIHMGLPTSPLRVSSPMLSSPVPGRLTTLTTLLFHFLWLLVSLFNRTSIPWSQRSSFIFIYFILIFFYMFLVWTIFKVFIEFVTILLLFYLLVFLFFFFWPQGRWKSLNTYLLESYMWLPSLTLQPAHYPLFLVW